MKGPGIVPSLSFCMVRSKIGVKIKCFKIGGKNIVKNLVLQEGKIIKI
jgi:hypothetical protein